MKLNFTLSLFILCLGGFFLMSNSAGRAASQASGNTGAPGETAVTCITCHGSTPTFGTDIKINLFDDSGNPVNNYVGGNSYTVSATINTTTTPAGYGLQMVSLLSDNTDTNGLSNASSNAQIVPLNGRNYLEQKSLSASEVFSAEWQAPAAGSGPVTFYAAGHAANGNGATSGDEAKTAIKLIEEQFVAVDEFEELGLQLSPNPVSNIARISLDRSINGIYEIFNISGKLVTRSNFVGDVIELDMSQEEAGFYFIKVSDSEKLSFQTMKFIKS